MRKTYSSDFKSKVAIEAIKGNKTMSELSSSFEVHRDQAKMEEDSLKRYSRAIFREAVQRKER
ncbi:MAG: hypothetical protein ACC630_06280 [Nitrospinota bacterium]